LLRTQILKVDRILNNFRTTNKCFC